MKMNRRFHLFEAIFVLFLLMPLPAEAQGRGNASAFYSTGRDFMAREEWYSAAESFLECLRVNPAYAEAAASLAECYYELAEFDQALTWVRKARSLARGNMALANLEASTLIALGQLEEASGIIKETLAREPYNKEALFTQAELDIAQGRTGDALNRYREAVRRFPDDRRVLVSLALVSGSLGDTAAAESYIERAMLLHPEDYRVYYYAAYLDAEAGRLSSAIRHAEEALALRPGFTGGRALLAGLRYRSGQFEEASRLADEAIAANRNDTSSWYLKGMANSRQGRFQDAIGVFSTAVSIDGEDEFVRSALEDLALSGTPVEDPMRPGLAAWHFSRARNFRTRNMNAEALFEYRRGLRLNPYAQDRRDYADLLRRQGYPSRYLEELRFLQELGLEKFPPNEARAINDAVESYSALLQDTLYCRWSVEPVQVTQRHWKLAIFTQSSRTAFLHADAGLIAASYIRDLLVHDRNIETVDLPLSQGSFSEAYRKAREAGVDYFLMVSLTENERDLSVKGELFVGRTGSPASAFASYRTGVDRLRNASRGITDQLSAALPFRGALLSRRANQGLLDKGKADGVTGETIFDLVKKGRVFIRNEGIGLIYEETDVVGTMAIEKADEEVSAGTLTRNGFFDRIEAGDEVILKAEKPVPPASKGNTANPELRKLLRTLR
ncbi:MAG: tetratricopeptide repeat protein [Treponema sp.]|jgi:tetratricopeptide (TPR) repeat protein|nr:tetratricopeptide repeat protein [Treponema sp.]